MKRRTLLAGLAGWGVAAQAAGFQDVLDTPAMPSALAARSLVVGLARAGDRLVAVGQRGHVLASDDAGQHWQQAQVPVSSDLNAAHFATPDLGWAVGHDGVILHSRDGGRRWTRQFDGRHLGPQGAETPLLDVHFDDATHGLAVGAFGTVLRTDDGGRRWRTASELFDNPQGLHLYALRRIAGELYVTGEQGLLFKREGERFAPLKTPYAGTLFGVVGNERALVAHGLRGNLVRSTDGGRSWRAVPSGVAPGLPAATVDARGRLVVVSQAGHVLVSSDDGASFAVQGVERPQPAAAVADAGNGVLVLGGPRGLRRIELN